MHKQSVLTLALICGAAAFSPAQEIPSLDWQALAPLPPAAGESAQAGLAGPFVGTHNGALIVAGGANFPDAPPWKAGAKKWWDDIYVYTDGGWTAQRDQHLPGPIAYGVSVSTQEGILCVGGSDSKECHAEAYWIHWDAGQIHLTDAPSLPKPVTMGAGAMSGSTVYVAGGQETATGAATAHVYALDLDATNVKWATLPDIPGGTRVLPIAAGLNGNAAGLYLFGGRRVAPAAPTELLTDAWRFVPEASDWEQLPTVTAAEDQPTCVMAGTAVGWKDNGVLVMSGDSGELFMALEHLHTDATRVGAREAAVLKSAEKQILENHPGFSRRMLYFDAMNKSWHAAGDLPFPSPVTTIAAWWNGKVVLASGEVRPGIRSPNVWAGTPKVGNAAPTK